MIRGLRTAIYPTPAQVLGIQPYFDEPFYAGLAASGFELGLVPDGEPGTFGVQVYWGTDDADAELARLGSLGAEVHEPVKDVGGGIRVATVRDPFGTLFGIIENPHFQDRGCEVGRSDRRLNFPNGGMRWSSANHVTSTSSGATSTAATRAISKSSSRHSIRTSFTTSCP